MTAKRVRRYVPSDDSDAALARVRAHLRAEGHGKVTESHATRWALATAERWIEEQAAKEAQTQAGKKGGKP